MRTRTISLPNISPSDERAWRDLARRSVEPNPFYEADFLLPACRHLGKGRRVALLVAEDAGQLHACIPVRSRRMRGPVITPWRHLYGFLGTPLVAPERGVEAVRAVLSALRGSGPWSRVIVLELFGNDGPIALYLRHAADELDLGIHVHASGDRAVVRCRDECAGPLPAKVKRERRAKARQWRRLCDELGAPTVVDRGGHRDGWSDFLAMEAAGWKGKAGTALSSRAEGAAFYRDVASRFGASGRLRLYSLEVANETLAMQTNLCASPGLFDWKVAYDERFAHYGPGVQLQLRVSDLACTDGLQWIDTCSDVKDEHQLRLSPDRRRIDTLTIARRGRLERPALSLAVLLVKVSYKLGQLSALSRRAALFGSYRSIRRIFRL